MYKKNANIWIATAISSFSVGVIVIVLAVIASLTFDKNFSNSLERASNAATVEVANKELNKAILYLEENQLTTGSTHVLYATPTTDIEYFYNNLKASSDELTKVSGDKGTQLDKSNALLRFHEVVLTSTGAIDMPDNLDIYPNQRLVVILIVLISLAFLGALYKLND